jgi:hypothetical protein
MKVNLEQTIVDFEGNPVVEKDKPVTVKTLVLRALNYSEQNDSPEVKMQRFTTMNLVMNGGDLTIEDIAMMKQACGKIYLPWVYGTIAKILESPKP